MPDSQKVTLNLNAKTRPDPPLDDDDELVSDRDATIVTAAPEVKPELLPKGLGSRLVATDNAISAAELLERYGHGEGALPSASSRPKPRPLPAQPTPKAARPSAPNVIALSSRVRIWIAAGVAALFLVVIGVGWIGYSLGQAQSQSNPR
jgi:hypothetical protein